MKKMFVMIAVALLVLPAAAMAQGLVGQCADCHTMHNSEQGLPVAMQYGDTQPSGDANPNLLRNDCLSCHANPDATASVYNPGGGSAIPQVYHNLTDDLAGGNFAYIDGSKASAQVGGELDRKGHNIVDFFAADADNGYYAPGDFRASATTGGGHNYGASGTYKTAFTCAGAVGCHGTRSQLLTGYTDENGDGPGGTGTDFYVNTAARQGLAAISGAHHNNYDGLKEPAQNTAVEHDGQLVADGYRFIQGLIGAGNMTDRWKNVSAASHNEYYGVPLDPDDNGSGTLLPGGSTCHVCHAVGDASVGGSERMTFNSTLFVPNQSMSGFCTTCHGKFHSSGGTSDGATGTGNDREWGINNGQSGAFLRHPSDYVMGGTTETAAYVDYNITAPVARQDLNTIADVTQVNPGDMVMCLSCHQAHATPFDGMLRFDYNAQIAGNAPGVTDGCLACHTTKGISKQVP